MGKEAPSQAAPVTEEVMNAEAFQTPVDAEQTSADASSGAPGTVTDPGILTVRIRWRLSGKIETKHIHQACTAKNETNGGTPT